MSLDFLLFLASLEQQEALEESEQWLDPLDMLLLDAELSSELASADNSSTDANKEKEQ